MEREIGTLRHKLARAEQESQRAYDKSKESAVRIQTMKADAEHTLQEERDEHQRTLLAEKESFNCKLAEMLRLGGLSQSSVGEREADRGPQTSLFGGKKLSEQLEAAQRGINAVQDQWSQERQALIADHAEKVLLQVCE
jgi:hypothetical protein